jgi:hypothetical protein
MSVIVPRKNLYSDGALSWHENAQMFLKAISLDTSPIKEDFQ